MVRYLAQKDHLEYQRFLDSLKDEYLFYAHRNYLDTIRHISGATEETLIFEGKDGKIKGALPLMSKSGKFGKVYNSLPFYGSHGGAISGSDGIRESLHDFVFSDDFGNDAALVMISENPFLPIENNANFGNDAIIEDRICQVTLLEGLQTDSDLMDQFHYKTRNMVRKSAKSNFKLVDSVELIDPMYKLHKQNMEAINGTVKPFSFYEQLLENFEYGKDYRVLGALMNDDLAAALLVFYHSDVVDYHTPTINIEYRNHQPNTFLIFECMKDALSKGFKFWNWGGTWKSQESLYRFKSRWGAADYDYRYIIKVINEEILTADPATLLSEYKYFYTVPFDRLK